MNLKTPDQIKRMRKTGLLLWETHALAGKLVEPGITTEMLNREAENYIYTRNAVPLFKPFLRDTTGTYVMTAYLFNFTISSNRSTHFGWNIDRIIIQPTTSGQLIYPHQRYKMNPSTIFNSRT